MIDVMLAAGCVASTDAVMSRVVVTFLSVAQGQKVCNSNHAACFTASALNHAVQEAYLRRSEL